MAVGAVSAAEPAATAATPSSVTVMDYYPPAARSAGVEGAASLRCSATEHLALRDCKIVNEAPAGYGFGAAALTLADLSKDNPEVSAPKQAGVVVFAFGLHPPSISPDTLQPYHLTLLADYAALPDARLMASLYPSQAIGLQIPARVNVDCRVGLNGKLNSCSVLDETPTGYGFGKAALKWAQSFRMKPKTVDGQPVDGAHIALPIVFFPIGGAR